jgi:copper chaperone
MLAVVPLLACCCPLASPAGVESFDVSLEQQRVVVRGNVTPQAVLETVSKTGKKAELVQ